MTEKTVTDRVARRRQETLTEILTAAWESAELDGLAGISLRSLATRLGMRPQSLAWYFPSKQELYDALYRQGHEDFRTRLDELAANRPHDVRTAAAAFAAFCVENPQRYQLMAQRTVPGFTPSPEARELARVTFGVWRRTLAEVGVVGRAHVDVLTAVVKGLVDQQITVDPTGDRFLRHLDAVVDLVVTHGDDLDDGGA
ncbi:TetR/AcrR family transcriptional regulator [Cryptosporangium aurantiacum]|uniref:Transcriptional regulator, TetR family n=1 Tax=Cryptosporangium aurantiacum TaxID=134849 RepID=A0A1M7RMA8_9ACTN|nr:TetR/AcrR family transcriptional regulator [Cryptosporangium aurantiacum]SHN47228.1 transcriptional regulator, TetR family [Cryptosporangium aurantiacum]